MFTSSIDALIEIAKLAVKRKTGARGLRSIMEDLFVDLMYESPDQKDLNKIVINSDVVTKKIEPMLVFSPKGNEKMLYVRGTAVVDTLQGSIDSATNAALSNAEAAAPIIATFLFLNLSKFIIWDE